MFTQNGPDTGVCSLVFYVLIIFSFVGASATSRGSFQSHPEPDVLILQEREKKRG
jgi:hypothetical protein